MTSGTCTARHSGDHLTLETPAYAFTFGTVGPLTAHSWKNLLTGTEIPLGDAPECEIDLDAADERIWIEGWRYRISEQPADSPDSDEGIAKGFAARDFRDMEWETIDMPTAITVKGENLYMWARTDVFLPRRCAEKPLALVLGGRDLFDFAYMRVFLNGQELATRRISGRWHEPVSIDLGPDTPGGGAVRWNGMNTVALQLGEQIHRTARLDELDPTAAVEFPAGPILASTFDQYFVSGTNTRTPGLIVKDVRIDGSGGKTCRACVSLASDDDGIKADIVYTLDADDPCMTREMTIRNTSGTDLRLLHLRSGPYATGTNVSEGGRGYPSYITDDRFISLAHPAGWATGQNNHILLRQFPGYLLKAGETWSAMQAVFGTAPTGQARKTFLEHVESRSRRVVRDHDHPYTIYEPFGSWSITEDRDLWIKESEEMLLRNLARVKKGQEEDGCTFDIYSIDFWVDYHSDLIRPAPDRFPNGLEPVLEELRRMNITPGLWIDSSHTGWSIGGNPALTDNCCHNHAYPAFPYFCRATDPAKTLYTEGFRHHIRENGVRLIKFDNLHSCCNNINHDHLPGVYSTEPVQNAVIEMLHGLDEESPDVFIMLYWGHRSPWWLLHGDTLFEPGLNMEAASPGLSPTLYARDGVTQGLDQAQRWCVDTPPLGKDSLGVWLSDWFWNSGVGPERWQEGFIMDMCRGSLLAQPWSDDDWLNPEERKQMAMFMELLKENPDCFRHPKLILGDPWKQEPYGYSCSDGERTFIALFNSSWTDLEADLLPDEYRDPPDAEKWQVFRWYPDPAHLDFGDSRKAVHIAMRPFDVTLLEIVPDGTAPSLNRSFPTVQPISNFSEPSRNLELSVIEQDESAHLEVRAETDEDAGGTEGQVKRTFILFGQVPTNSAGGTAEADGTIAVSVELFRGSKRFSRRNAAAYFAVKASVGGGTTEAEPVLAAEGYPSGWQAWRIAVPPGCEERTLELTCTVMLPEDVEVRPQGRFIPG